MVYKPASEGLVSPRILRTAFNHPAKMSNISTESPQRKLVNEFFEGLMDMNIEIVAKHLHKDFRRFTYPRSLNKPEQNREEWLRHFEEIIRDTTDVKVSYTNYPQTFFPQSPRFLS